MSSAEHDVTVLTAQCRACQVGRSKTFGIVLGMCLMGVLQASNFREIVCQNYECRVLQKRQKASQDMDRLADELLRYMSDW